MSCRSYTSGDIEPLFDPIWTRDIISTPPETTRSSCPDHTAAAALKFVCIDEPHCRSTVVPHTVTGQPAVSAMFRPMFHACSSTCVTQPHWRSSTRPGSTSLPATSALTTCAERSSPRMCDNVPFFLPIGLRSASTISASVPRAMDTLYPGRLTHATARRDNPAMLGQDAKIKLIKSVPLFADCSRREL